MKRLTTSVALLMAFHVSAHAVPVAGAFSREQVASGRALYDAHCAGCHGAELAGGNSSKLKGDDFLVRWSIVNQSVGDLYYLIRSTMPLGSGGVMSKQEYIDIVAYILAENGHPPGAATLDPDDPSIEDMPVGLAEHRRLAEARGALCPEARVLNLDDTPSADAGPRQADLSAADNPADWLLPARTYDGQRFSPLKQINETNVADLRTVCRYDTGDAAPFQTSPLVHDGVLYFTTQTATFAVDAATCAEKWRYDRPLRCTELWGRSRGLALKDGYAVRGTTDGYLLALNAATGKPVWERRINDTEVVGVAVPMPPLIYQDLVIIGPATSEIGIKGWVRAYELATGRQVWNFNIVPDGDEEGADSWGTEDTILEHGGGGIWTAFTLDVETGFVYLATGNPGPALMPGKRPGENLYTNSLVVLDVRTGERVWHEQIVKQDFHDWDLTQASPLITADHRRLVLVGGKDGYLRAFDRATHDHVYTIEVSRQENANVMTKVGQDVHFCPGSYGGMQWNGPAYSPVSSRLFVGTVEWCTSMRQAEDIRYVRGSFYMGGYFNMDPVEEAKGQITAYDAATGSKLWRYDSRRPVLAAVTPTAGGILFAGEMTGEFIALDAGTGQKLYAHDTGAPLNGGIVTYSVGGRQFVAVAAGAASSIWLDRPAEASIQVFALPE